MLHVAVFNSLLQFEIAMFDFPLQFFTCASIRTSEFLRHTAISIIKLLKDIFFYIVQFASCFWQSFPHFVGYVISLPLPAWFARFAGFAGFASVLPGFPGFAEISWICGCSLGFVRFDGVYWWHSAQVT